MPSTYTTNGGIEKIATGEQSGTWGTTTNLNFDIIDRLHSGVGTIDLSSSGAAHTLTTTDGTLSDGMYKVLVLSGATQACTITVSPNDAQKLYFVDNNSGQDCTFSQGSGANVTIGNGKTGIIFCNGAGSGAAVNQIIDTTSLVDFGVTATSGELNYVDGVTSAIQTQIDSKANIANPTFTTGITSPQVDVTAQGDLRLQDTSGGQYVALQAPSTVSSSYTLTLPAADGSASQVLATNGSGVLSFAAPGNPVDYQEFTSSGTYTKPSGVNYIYVEAIGGGAGGGGAAFSGDRRGGGGGGEFTKQLLRASDVSSSVSVTIGAGGAGGAAGGNNGSVGGSTTFGSYVTSRGGGYGSAISGGYSPGDIDASLLPFPNAAYGGGGTGAFEQFNGGSTTYGGGGGGSNVGSGADGSGSGAVTTGGTSVYGGAGGAGGNASTAPQNGTAPGGGGGGGYRSTDAGGSGAAGRVRVWGW
tara:strand:+ start:4694 stop:6106 length:1413 start_codon:yes stop_codon:yes gene_type:complete